MKSGWFKHRGWFLTQATVNPAVALFGTIFVVRRKTGKLN